MFLDLPFLVFWLVWFLFFGFLVFEGDKKHSLAILELFFSFVAQKSLFFKTLLFVSMSLFHLMFLLYSL